MSASRLFNQKNRQQSSVAAVRRLTLELTPNHPAKGYHKLGGNSLSGVSLVVLRLIFYHFTSYARDFRHPQLSKFAPAAPTG